MSRLATAIALAAACAVSACSILEPQPDPSRFFVLTAVTDTSALTDDGGPLTLGLGPIRFPDYLARSQIVTRVGPNQVVFSEFERWAEPLERNFGRVLGENLSRLLNTEKIISLPAFVPVAVQFEVPMEVLRFEGDDKGVVELWVRWAIRSPSDGKLLHARESRAVEAAAGTEMKAMVAAMSVAVGKLGEEIADEIRRLSPSRVAQ